VAFVGDDVESLERPGNLRCPEDLDGDPVAMRVHVASIRAPATYSALYARQYVARLTTANLCASIAGRVTTDMCPNHG